MTFGEHLDELRATLIKSILRFVIGFLVALIFAGRLVDYVQTPLRSHSRNITARWPNVTYSQEFDRRGQKRAMRNGKRRRGCCEATPRPTV